MRANPNPPTPAGGKRLFGAGAAAAPAVIAAVGDAVKAPATAAGGFNFGGAPAASPAAAAPPAGGFSFGRGATTTTAATMMTAPAVGKSDTKTAQAQTCLLVIRL